MVKPIKNKLTVSIMRTYIETSTKSRFATRFMAMDSNVPTFEYVLVSKHSQGDGWVIVTHYRESHGEFEDLGTKRITESEFMETYTPHCDYENTTMGVFADTFEEARNTRKSYVSQPTVVPAKSTRKNSQKERVDLKTRYKV
jgi:hypothetical protein